MRLDNADDMILTITSLDNGNNVKSSDPLSIVVR